MRSQTANSILGSLLAQLCVQIEEFPNGISEEYYDPNPAEATKTTSPKTQTIINALIDLCNRHDVFLFIDAVDELDDGEELLDALDPLLTCSKGVKVFVTSRTEVQISERLRCKTVQIDLVAKVAEMDRDISLYINGRVQSDRRLSWSNPGIGKDISQMLQSKSVGM